MRRTTYYFLFYAFFCLLQFFFGKYINIGGVFPNFILIAIIYLGFTRGRLGAQTMGFIFGLTWDSFSTDIFGVRALMFTIIGYFAGMFNRQFDKDQIIAQLMAVLCAEIFYWFGFSMICFILPEGSGSYTPFVFTLSGSLKILVTVLVTPLVFLGLNFASKSVRRYL
ncbi:MAG: rod shape-determining protein MreD [Endomicrobia bacterium]|nr:rod shape-determining protein MreD [Endomicrobiia bacterium]MCL2507008.1 rod shape-determining protein MreD [Endomicrobiia bacterium]